MAITANVLFKQLTAAQFDALLTKSNTTFYRVVKTDNSEDLYIGNKRLNNAQDILDALAALTADDVEYQAASGGDPAVSIKDALDDIYSQLGEGGGVADQIATAIAALDTSSDVGIASVSNNVVTIKGSISETDGVIGAGSGTDVVLEEVAYTGAAADVSVADTAGKITATTVEGALAEFADAIADANNAGKVTVETPSSSSYAAVYEFYQGVLQSDDATAKAAKKIATINIPKDMVISAGEVKTVTTADTPYQGAVVGDKYLDITIANNDGTHLYIPVKDLVDTYTGSVGAEATVVVGNDNSIGVTINKVGANKIVYTAADPSQSIAEETVAQAIARLETAADTGVDTKISNAIAALDASESQTAGADGLALAVTQVDGVITSISGSIAANVYDEYGAASTVETALIGDASTDTASSTTIAGAKKYADSLAVNYDVAGAAATAESNAESYADSAIETAINNALTWEVVS